MPRERITSNGTPDSTSPFDLHVGWSPGHYMQVGIQVSDSDFDLLDLLYGSQHGVAVGVLKAFAARGWKIVEDPDAAQGIPVPRLIEGGEVPLRELEEGDVHPLAEAVFEGLRGNRGPVERDGLWADLRRDEANRLVRFVRKARDAVYGRDE